MPRSLVLGLLGRARAPGRRRVSSAWAATPARGEIDDEIPRVASAAPHRGTARRPPGGPPGGGLSATRGEVYGGNAPGSRVWAAACQRHADPSPGTRVGGAYPRPPQGNARVSSSIAADVSSSGCDGDGDCGGDARPPGGDDGNGVLLRGRRPLLWRRRWYSSSSEGDVVGVGVSLTVSVFV